MQNQINITLNKTENLSSWMSKVVSRVPTKGWKVGDGGLGKRYDFKWRYIDQIHADMRLQGCAGFLVADM